MTIHWEKKGKIFCAADNNKWMVSRGYLPTPLLIDPEVIRIYFSALDKDNIGRTGYLDVEAKNPNKIISISEEPVLDIGAPGTFDDSGVNATCILKQEDRLLMYYQGWEILNRVPYNILAGIAISEDGGQSFKRYKTTPLLERSEGEMNIRSAPCVLQEGKFFKLWYNSGGGFISYKDKQAPVYGVSHLTSLNPFEFPGQGTSIMSNTGLSDTFGIARTWVVKKEDLYLIWFSERSHSKIYRMKFAISRDGIDWKTGTNSMVCPDVSESGWDSEMVGFPTVIETQYGTYMFYNGNGYGATGFGYAKLQGSLDDIVQMNSNLK